jgi:hypothetical protein
LSARHLGDSILQRAHVLEDAAAEESVHRCILEGEVDVADDVRAGFRGEVERSVVNVREELPERAQALGEGRRTARVDHEPARRGDRAHRGGLELAAS